MSPFAETVTDPRELEPKHILLINIRQLSFAMLTFSFADPDPGSCAFSSVADPGCLSIPDQTFFHPGFNIGFILLDRGRGSRIHLLYIALHQNHIYIFNLNVTFQKTFPDPQQF